MDSFPIWVWVSVGGLLLIAEILGAGGFLLGTGVAAFVIALLSAVFEVNWYWQLGLFAVLSVVFSYIYIRYMKPNSSKTEDPILNNRLARLVGHQTPLQKPVENGFGRVQIHDAFWTVQAETDLPVETVVKIIGYEGSNLIVEAVDKSAHEGGKED